MLQRRQSVRMFPLHQQKRGRLLAEQNTRHVEQGRAQAHDGQPLPAQEPAHRVGEEEAYGDHQLETRTWGWGEFRKTGS